MEKMFTEFNGTTNQSWKEQIVKDLKGIDFNSLIWKSPNGIDVKPFYTREDQPQELPPLSIAANWDVCHAINVENVEVANKEALSALAKGCSGLVFNIQKNSDTNALLKNISLEHIYTEFNISNDAISVLDSLKAQLGKKNSFDGKEKVFVNIDPLSLFAFYGEWHENQEADLSIVDELPYISVNAALYQESGATQVNEIATALAHTNDYLHHLSTKNKLQKQTLHLRCAIGSDFFAEIAKLRAYRYVMALLLKQYNLNMDIHISCTTTSLNKSEKDAYNNMLRSTTEAMSAVIGGCNSLSIMPYNHRFEAAGEFGSRIAINQQHLLKEESYLGKVADSAAGSYYVENLTHQLADKAWEAFKIMESKGGFICCLEIGEIQNTLHNDFNSLADAYKNGRLILLGVNKFPNPKDEIHHVKKPLVSENGKKIRRILPKNLSDLL
jgi:methylmalonyl-CoA mutase